MSKPKMKTIRRRNGWPRWARYVLILNQTTHAADGTITESKRYAFYDRDPRCFYAVVLVGTPHRIIARGK